jgi:hypothetical protein
MHVVIGRNHIDVSTQVTYQTVDQSLAEAAQFSQRCTQVLFLYCRLSRKFANVVFRLRFRPKARTHSRRASAAQAGARP